MQANSAENQADLRLYATALLRARVPPEQLPAAVQKLVRASKGLFAYLAKVAERLPANGRLESGDLEMDLSNTLEGAYLRTFQQLAAEQAGQGADVAKEGEDIASRCAVR